MASYVEELAARLEAAGVLPPNERRGCSPAEIEKVRRAQGVRAVPERYRDFLAVLGRRPLLMLAADWRYEDLLILKGEALGLLMEHEADDAFLDGALVFQMKQGIQFLFIQAADLEMVDPPVWVYHGGAGARPLFSSFTSFLDHAAGLA